MSPSSPCCGFCRKPPERDGDCSKWKKISDTSSLQAFWCDLTTLRGSNDKSFATRKACKVCGECNTLWKQWAKAFQTLKALQLKKEDLLGKLNKVIPYANGSGICTKGLFQINQPLLDNLFKMCLFQFQKCFR